jgi:enoyl-CoA hydratase/carnithine racemase
MDLELLAAADPLELRAVLREAVREYVELLSGIQDCPRPVVAAVRGSVRAGGVGLVSACDVVVASEQSTFELSEALFGLIPANVLPFLLGPRLALQKARYLVLTARRLSAGEARGIGLVDEVYPPAELERGVRELLRRMLRTSPEASAQAKAFTRELVSLGPAEARSRAQEKLAELLEDPRTLGAIRAFAEGQAPAWFGKLRPAGPLLGD